MKTLRNLLTIIVLILFCSSVSGQTAKVKLVRMDDKQKVEVIIDGKLFTAYQYPKNQEKPFLFPVVAPNGTVITRGFPLEPRKGERVDHPHHIGIWFNHGNVNGLDFWNNSYDIPAGKKDAYGHIVVREVVKVKSGKIATLVVVSDWDDNKGAQILSENATYYFSGDKNSRTVDHVSVLTAVAEQVVITDNKEGMLAIRVDRAFEMPSNESLIFTDANGNPTTVKAIDNTGVTGMYKSSNGKTGDAVWGTRNEWVVLTGTKDNAVTSFGIFDHPENPGFPAYAHARGYGLFSVNNLGQNSYDPKAEKVNYTLKKGESLTIRHRFYLQTGAEITTEKASQIFKDFSAKY